MSHTTIHTATETPGGPAIPSVDRAWELLERAWDDDGITVLGWADNMVVQAAGRPTTFTVTPRPIRTHEDSVIILAITVPHPDEMTLDQVVNDRPDGFGISRVQPRDERTVVRFAVADADAIVGRKLTEAEVRDLGKTLGHSSMGEVLEECVGLHVATKEDDDDE